MTGGAPSRNGRATHRCERCDRPASLERRALRAGLRLCEECLPRFESALAAWFVSSAGAQPDATARPL